MNICDSNVVWNKVVCLLPPRSSERAIDQQQTKYSYKKCYNFHKLRLRNKIQEINSYDPHVNKKNKLVALALITGSSYRNKHFIAFKY